MIKFSARNTPCEVVALGKLLNSYDSRRKSFFFRFQVRSVAIGAERICFLGLVAG
jgi:hypothetical protein